MSREFEPSHIKDPNPSFDYGRRRFLITTALMIGGSLSMIAGVECSNRILAEAKDLETQIIRIYLQSEDPKKAMQTVEELKQEVSRKNFIRDRLDVLPIFGGGFMLLMGTLRLLKFI